MNTCQNGTIEPYLKLSNSSSYLFFSPDEFILLPPDDSVSNKAQIADTEYTDEVGINDDSVSNKAQIADTEYTAEAGINDDSVSNKAQVADTEYTAPPADNYDSVSKAISTYRPRGTARSGEYFRFSYRDGSRIRHIHIRGGNTDSLIAQAKVAEVRSLLAAGIPPAEIAAMLRQSSMTVESNT